MKKLILLYVFLFLIIANDCISQMPKVSSGTIQQFQNFHSKYVAARNIDVWFPPRYDKNKKYPVLYMQDGRALFDTTIMWNKQEWGVDETMELLLQRNAIRECIVVGIWNSEATRQVDYFPQKVFQLLNLNQQADYYEANIGDRKLLIGKVQSDSYLKFMVKELKPFIDSAYNDNVLADAKNTFVAGSSYGGLISLYAICEYPNIFSRAACLSTHWPGILTVKDNPIPDAIITYLKGNLPDPKNHKIYFDYGSKTLDSLYKPIQQKVDIVMKVKGYTLKNWATKEFTGADHTEKSWAKRLSIPLAFLLGTNEKQ